MNRSLKLSVLAALALGSSQALALNLGQIQVKSALGQPLRVEIPVNPASPADLQNLSARLASSDAFTRAGITDGRPAVPLQFQIADEHGRKVILVTSSAPVNNPYIDLLIEVSSAAGTSVHEYPVLLDPPSSKVAAATSGKRHAAQPAPARQAAAAAAPRAASARPAQASRAKNGQYGPVKRGETLSTVARDVLPQGVNVDQMMLALKQANPDAFYRDNINALKAGAVLRVPSRDDALAMKVAEAAAAVRQQNGDWSGGAARMPTTVAAGATRAGASTSPSSHASAGDRLALVPAAAGGAGSGNGKHASDASLRQDLQRSQESLASLKQQSADLNSRLKDLQDINSKNQRLLSLKDNEIAALQAKLVAARKAAGLPPPKPVEGMPAPAGAASSSATAPLAAAVAPHDAATAPAHAGSTNAATPMATTGSAATPAQPASVVAKPAVAPVAKKPVTHPHPVARPVPAPEQPWYMQTWAMIAGAAVVVLGLLLLLASRGRRGKTAAPARPAASSLADRFGDAPAVAAAGSDPDQDELLDQLAEHPDDVGLHLELVSLYYSRRDVEHFEAAAEAMYAHVTSPQQDEWQDVVHMGEDLTPGHPLFARADAAQAHDEHDLDAFRHDSVQDDTHDAVLPPRDEDELQALDEFDLDNYADEAPAVSAAGTTPPPLRQNQKVSEYHFDFNLTPQQARAQAAAEQAGSDLPPPEADPQAVPAVHAGEDAEASSWNFDEPAASAHAEPAGEDFGDFGELNDDPIDTKLDLARAYLDMGDPDGARAMLDEVMQEGSQMQKDVAKGLLDKLA